MRIASLLALALVGIQALAFDYRLDGTIGNIEAEHFSASDVFVEMPGHLSGDSELTLKAGRLTLHRLEQTFEDVSIQCSQATFIKSRISCSKGKIRARVNGLGLSSNLEFDYKQSDGVLVARLDPVDFGTGRVSLTVRSDATSWLVSIGADGLSLPQLASIVPAFASVEVNAGVVSGSVELNGDDQGPKFVDYDIQTSGLTLSSTSGDQATENLQASVDGQWRRVGEQQEISFNLTSQSGQAYVDPIFLELKTGDRFALSGSGTVSSNGVTFENLQLDHANVLNASGSLDIGGGNGSEFRSAWLNWSNAQFPAAFETYVQPFLADTMLAKLETSGELGGSLQFDSESLLRLNLNLSNINLDDPADRFALENLNGQVNWQASGGESSTLSWTAAQIYQLPVGAGQWQFRTSGDTFEQVGISRFPLLDGALSIRSLRGRGIGSGDISWIMEPELEAVELADLCRAFGWVPLAGKLSLASAHVQLNDHILEVGGNLDVGVFDGLVRISNLHIEEPFGLVPTLGADILIDNLDLETLTRAFSFGRIEGKLSGRLSNLQMQDWTPTYFEVQLATPVGDKSKHRISQRAVENLSSIGGGASAALSKGFLGIFKDFAYKKLGFSGVLNNGIFEMDGVGKAKQGYYLVQGGGLPRIDVVGFESRVDWNELLLRLKAAAASEGPVMR